jgi:hypothetical protein
VPHGNAVTPRAQVSGPLKPATIIPIVSNAACCAGVYFVGIIFHT